MKRIHLYIILWVVALLCSCHQKSSSEEEEETSPEEVQTPVTVTNISTVSLAEYVDLNATSAFLQSNFVKSTVNGYIKSVSVHMGQDIGIGQAMFTLKTKEAESLGNTINNLDSSFRFSGSVRISAPQHGYITQLNHQVGDYVQEGEQLAVISDFKSFVFILNLPYELKPFLIHRKTVELQLPDGTHLNGTIASMMPSIDSASQTQRILIKINSSISIPENLIAKVHVMKREKTSVPSLPKEAVLTDESQTNFWVMKMIDSITAIKVPIIKGMETIDRVEIVQPQFSVTDKILLSGNYGLPDTAKVKIVKTEQ